MDKSARGIPIIENNAKPNLTGNIFPKKNNIDVETINIDKQ